MINWPLEKHAQIGIKEGVASYTVAIDTSLAAKHSAWGSGSLIKIGKRFFILTCKHVVKESYSNDKLSFFFKPDKEWQDASINEIKKSSLPELTRKTKGKSFPEEFTIINRFYSDDTDDLVLLELSQSSPQVKKYAFYDLSTRKIVNPEINMSVYLCGFSVELTKLDKRHGFCLFPYFLGSHISDKKIDSSGFNPSRHFLIDFEKTEDSVDPHGLSGCGVWTRLPSGEGNLWTPNLYLVGVETCVYEKSQLLGATKVDRISKLIK